MKIRKIYERGDGVAVEFIKIANVPGFSHRVIINGKAVDWLSADFKPSAVSAEYYAEKHYPKKGDLT